MGADSAVTSITSTGQQTSMQPARKLNILSENVIVGFSGFVGLGQFYIDEIKKLWDTNGLSNICCADVRVKITNACRNHLHREVDSGRITKELLGRIPQDEIISSMLVALPIQDQSCLIQFTATLASEEITERVPTVAIGIGQPIADPFLGFLRKRFWPEKLPGIADGKLATYWVLKYSIEFAPGNVGPPIKIATLEKVDNMWRTCELSQEELNDLDFMVSDIEKYIQNYKSPPPKNKIKDIPSPPKT